MHIIVTANPFFNIDYITPEQVKLFYGLQLTGLGPFEGDFEEKFFLVPLFQLHSKLMAPHYGKAHLLFRTQIYTFVALAEEPFFEEVANLLEVPLRASACMITNGAIH